MTPQFWNPRWRTLPQDQIDVLMGEVWHTHSDDPNIALACRYSLFPKIDLMREFPQDLFVAAICLSVFLGSG